MRYCNTLEEFKKIALLFNLKTEFNCRKYDFSRDFTDYFDFLDIVRILVFREHYDPLC